MDLTLKIIAGPDKDQEFSCHAPETYLGRSQRCAIRLSSPSISFEHALITRKGDEFFVENLSANGTLLNNDRLSSGANGSKTRLRAKDQLQLGADTLLRVESLPAAATAGSSRRWLLVLFVLMLVALLAVVITDPFSGTSSGTNWSNAYRDLQQFSQDQADQHLLPADFPAMFREAWRLQSARGSGASADRTAAATAWKRLTVLLDYWDEKQGRTNSSSTRNLEALCDGKHVDLSDDDHRTALKQFTTQMSRGK